jgi:hypothetical protein
MFRYKGFDSAAFGDDLQRLEASVNEWMDKQRPRIRMMSQSPRGEHLVVSFVYENNNDSELRLSQRATVPEVFERTLDDADLDPQEVDDTGLPEAELPY